MFKEIAHVIYPFLALNEVNKINRYSKERVKYPLYFIAGAPKSGGEILYDILTHYLDVVYPDGIVEKYGKNIFTAFELSNFIFKDKPRRSFSLGKREKYHSPVEFNLFWNRFFDPEEDFADSESVSAENINYLRMAFKSIINRFGPLLMYNQKFGVKLRLLNNIFPDCRIIWVKSNPVFTAQSVFIHRNQKKINHKEWWGCKPENWAEFKDESLVKRIVRQIFEIEKQINSDKALFGDRFMTVDTEDLSSTINTTERIRIFMGKDINYRLNAEDNKHLSKKNRKVSEKVFLRMMEEVQNYDWFSYENSGGFSL